MAVPIHPAQTHGDEAGREETFLHFAARESRVFLRWTALALVVITAVTMVTFWFWAIIPALLLLATVAALLLAQGVEQYSEDDSAESRDPAAGASQSAALHVSVDGDVDELPGQTDPVEKHLIWRESANVMLLFGSLGIVAFIVALILLPPAILWLSILVLVAYMLLVAAPVWLGSIEDDIDHESARLTRREEP